MQSNGSTINQILAAGEWRSAAFMEYLDEMDLEVAIIKCSAVWLRLIIHVLRRMLFSKHI